MSQAPLFPRPIAHRGLHRRADGIVENSASAFEAAIDAGFAIECDLQLSADGVPVVFHDNERTRLQGVDGAVADTDAAEITATPLLDSAGGDRPQTLDAFLEQVAGRALLQIELKRQRDAANTQLLARATAEALKSYEGEVTIESFDPHLITAVRQFGFAGPRGIIVADYSKESSVAGMPEDHIFVLQHLLHWHETGFDFVSCAKDALDLPGVVFWRALGRPVTAWTVRSPEEAEAALAHCDQIVFEGFDPDARSDE